MATAPGNGMFLIISRAYHIIYIADTSAPEVSADTKAQDGKLCKGNNFLSFRQIKL